MVNLLVSGEAPQEASQDVSHPEESVNQHRFVVLVAHPVVLGQNCDTYGLDELEHLTGDGWENLGVVEIPTLVARRLL